MLQQFSCFFGVYIRFYKTFPSATEQNLFCLQQKLFLLHQKLFWLQQKPYVTFSNLQRNSNPLQSPSSLYPPELTAHSVSVSNLLTPPDTVEDLSRIIGRKGHARMFFSCLVSSAIREKTKMKFSINLRSEKFSLKRYAPGNHQYPYLCYCFSPSNLKRVCERQ